VGASRIVSAVAIPHPTGNPNLPYKKEVEVRRNIVNNALKLLQQEIADQTII
jgi:betaine reductase